MAILPVDSGRRSQHQTGRNRGQCRLRVLLISPMIHLTWTGKPVPMWNDEHGRMPDQLVT